MIFLARAAGTKIFLKIDQRLLSLLSSDNYKEYFSNNKKDSFEKLYQFISDVINSNNNSYNVLDNNSGFLRNKNKNRNNIIQRYKTTNNAELKDKLRREIRVRRILIELGFKDWQQFFNMNEFFKNIIGRNKEIFIFTLHFDLKSFLSRFKICKGNGSTCFQDIPLSRFGKLSSDDKSFIFTDTNKNTNDIYQEYEYLLPFLDYIIGPSSTDVRRAMCMAYATGSTYYPGLFKIILQTSDAAQGFENHSCFQAIYFYKFHKDRTYPFSTKEEYIEFQIKSKIGNDFSLA
jgi:hypothetical protein